MNSELIYEKTYPRPAWDEEPELAEEFDSDPFLSYFLDSALVPIPGRLAESERFIELAQKTAEDNRLDVKILRRDHGIVVRYTLSGINNLRRLCPLMVMADSIHTFSPRGISEIILCMNYSTHVALKKDEVIPSLLYSMGKEEHGRV